MGEKREHRDEQGTFLEASMLDSLHLKKLARQDVGRRQFDELLTPISKMLLEKGFGELLVAYAVDGTPLSAPLFIRDDKVADFLFGANDPKYCSTVVARYVLFESLARGIERNHRRIDFVGVKSPQSGEFKINLRAIPIPCFETNWTRP